MIYLDHAATTPLCKESLQAMLPYLQNQYANPSSSYSMAREARRAIDQAKIQIAALVGANPQEIYVDLSQKLYDLKTSLLNEMHNTND